MAYELKAAEQRAPTTTVSGFWLLDESELTASDKDDFFTQASEAVGSTAPVEVKREPTDDDLTREEQDASELKRNAPIQRTVGDLTLLYATFIPKSLESRMCEYGGPLLTYLGATWSEARGVLHDDTLWGKLWPKGYMDHVVAGWERDSA